ncbi:MAG: hypothetical protein J07HX5_00640 [halophilic archaeon J07HX5]|nr:MAG: hypothetical protein J07HX5_00640 [halophilic archaeon J07HX5]
MLRVCLTNPREEASGLDPEAVHADYSISGVEVGYVEANTVREWLQAFTLAWDQPI